MHISVKSFGCSTNLADGEVLAGCLAEAGYGLVASVEEADLVICNTCAVKGPTEDSMIGFLKRIPENKKVIVAGCLPLINFERLQKEVHLNAVVGPARGDRIVEVVKRVLNGEKVVCLGENYAKPSLNLPKLQSNPVVSIIPISYGCLGSCAYCCVVFARGRLRSCSIREIVDRVERDLAKGIREFWITSQDTACYGKDLGTNLAELLDAICNIEGDFRVRVGMMTPNRITDMLSDMIEVFRSEKIFKFIHLPIQSGDNQTLKRMRRFYTVKEFKEIINAFRKSFPEITFSTDIICGFPTESEKAFDKTLRLIEEIKPDIVNVSKFFARPKTVAAGMKEEFVLLQEIRRRSNIMSQLAKEISFERNKRWLDWTGEILIDELGKTSGSWIGRNFAYKPVVLKEKAPMLGKTVRVKIVKAYTTYLEGKTT